MRQRRLPHMMLLVIVIAIYGQCSMLSAQASTSVPTSGSAAAAAQIPDQVPDQLAKEFELMRKKAPGSEKKFATSATTYIPYLVAPTTTQQLFHAFEEQRVDVQVTTSQSAGSSTSTTNKGSVPWLFGFAVENGALTQSVENSQIVLRGNVANAVSALKFKDYITSFNKIQEQNAIVRNIAKTSFSITFEPSQTTNSAASPTNQTNNFSGFSAHYDIWNHRDPRDQRWRKSWAGTLTQLTGASNAAQAFQDAFIALPPAKGVGIAPSDPVIVSECLTISKYNSGGAITGSKGQTCSLSDFKGVDGKVVAGATAAVVLTDTNSIMEDTQLTIINKGSGATTPPITATLGNGTAECKGTAVVSVALETPCSQWKELAETEFNGLSSSATDPQISAMFKALGDDLAAKVKSSPQIITAAQNTVAKYIEAGNAKAQTYDDIMKSPTVSLEYTYVRQATNQIPSSTSTTTMSIASPLPNLSTFNLIFNCNFLVGSQLSLNGIATIFNSLPPGSKGGSMRDVEVTAQLDIPLFQIASIGKPTLTLSGLYMDLINQPLGQQILVNGVPESRTGNIGLFQGKFTIPAGKGSGVQIPLSFTYANRTELIKESDVRGAIGVTFNLDSIFSKPQ